MIVFALSVCVLKRIMVGSIFNRIFLLEIFYSHISFIFKYVWSLCSHSEGVRRMHVSVDHSELTLSFFLFVCFTCIP